MLSPPTQGIGGEVARSESKQGGAEGLGRAVQQRAARSAEVRSCGTQTPPPPTSQRCENTCKVLQLTVRSRHAQSATSFCHLERFCHLKPFCHLVSPRRVATTLPLTHPPASAGVEGPPQDPPPPWPRQPRAPCPRLLPTSITLHYSSSAKNAAASRLGAAVHPPEDRRAPGA